MTTRTILDKNRILQVETTTAADADLMKHISSTVLGTPGNLRYQLTQIKKRLDHSMETHFVILTRKGKILGSIAFMKRDHFYKGQKSISWYIRYFSINAPLGAKSNKKKKLNNSGRGSTLLKDIAIPYMENPCLLLENHNPEMKSYVYGYVESHNLRSMNFSNQMGSVTVRKYKTLIFTRLAPGKKAEVRKIDRDEIPEMRKKLESFYGGYNFFTMENLFLSPGYHVMESDGEIVAGAQVHSEFWRILDMKGRMSKLLIRVLPALPYIRRFFNPKQFRFLAIEGIWYKKGYEGALNRFFESLCSLHNNHFALTWADHESDLYKILDKNLDFGLIGNSFERAEVDVRVTFTNFSEEEKREFIEKPAYISAFDMT